MSGAIPTGDGSTFRERIESGAFKRILRTNPDVVALFNHDSNKLLGRTTAGTLRLSEDSRGLAFECDVPNTQVGNDTYESVSRGDLSGMSFAFMVDDKRMTKWREEDIGDEDEDNSLRGRAKRMVRGIVRSIRDFANLIDVSVVTHPAYPQTSVDARNLLVGAECRSRVAAIKAQSFVSALTLAEIRQRMEGQSFEDMIEQAKVRKRRLAILDL